MNKNSLKPSFPKIIRFMGVILCVLSFALLKVNVVSAAECPTSAACSQAKLSNGISCQSSKYGSIYCCPAGKVIDDLSGCVDSGNFSYPACGLNSDCAVLDLSKTTPVRGAVACMANSDNSNAPTMLAYCCPPGTQFNSSHTECLTPPAEPDDNNSLGLPTDNLSKETLNDLNPLKQYSQGVDEDLSKPAGIISRVLRFAFPIAGLILFVMLVWSGFEILSGAASKKSLDAGKQRATAAVIGFGLLFVSYWLTQIIEVIFGVKIL